MAVPLTDSNKHATFEDVVASADTSPGTRTIEWSVVDYENSTYNDENELVQTAYKTVEAKRTFDEHGVVNVFYSDFESRESTSIVINREEINDDGSLYSYRVKEIDDYTDNRCGGKIKITRDGRLSYYRCHDIFGDCFWVGPSFTFSLITGVILTRDLKTSDYKHIKD